MSAPIVHGENCPPDCHVCRLATLFDTLGPLRKVVSANMACKRSFWNVTMACGHSTEAHRSGGSPPVMARCGHPDCRKVG